MGKTGPGSGWGMQGEQGITDIKDGDAGCTGNTGCTGGRRCAAVPALQPSRTLLSFSSSRRAFNEVLQPRLCRAGSRGGDPVTHILISPRAALAGDSCKAPGRDGGDRDGLQASQR